jgi:predicted amidohydrolase
MTKAKGTILAGAAQLPATRLDEGALALARIDAAIEDAASKGVELLVLPEGAYPCYWLPGVDDYRAADVLSNDAFLSHLGAHAKQHGLHVVCGFVEDNGEQLRNAAVVIDDHGAVIGRSYKSILWGDDNKVFTPGDKLEVIDTRLGRVGIAICADVRAPETTTGLAARGAELIVVPTCWVNLKRRPGEYYNPQPDFLIHARAREISRPFVCANKIGVETDLLSYCGYSLITDSTGHAVAKAPADEPALVTATIELGRGDVPALPDWTLDRIITTMPAESPTVGNDDTFRLAALPGSLLTESSEADALRELAADGVAVAASSVPSEEIADELRVYARTLGIEFVGYPRDERVMLARFGSYSALPGTAIPSFGPARALALDGAAVLFVMDPPDDLVLLRARAAENQVYVVAVGAQSATIIGPDGTIISHTASWDIRAVTASIDLRAAANKVVFPGTDIFEQRKPQAYAAAFGRSGR